MPRAVLAVSLFLFILYSLSGLRSRAIWTGFAGDEVGRRGGMTGDTGAQPVRPAGNMYMVVPNAASSEEVAVVFFVALETLSELLLPISIFVVAQESGALQAWSAGT